MENRNWNKLHTSLWKRTHAINRNVDILEGEPSEKFDSIIKRTNKQLDECYAMINQWEAANNQFFSKTLTGALAEYSHRLNRKIRHFNDHYPQDLFKVKWCPKYRSFTLGENR